MMGGVGKCKELDEWLMGSGQSAETAESKENKKPELPLNNIPGKSVL
jgi:hypothetical protein